MKTKQDYQSFDGILLEIQLLFHHNENTRLVDTFSKLSREQYHVPRYFAHIRDGLNPYISLYISFSRDPMHKETR